HLPTATVAFPVSVPCSPASKDPEEYLNDLLDELKGRMPAAFRSRTHADDRPDDSKEDASHDEEHDAELALLTKTEHQGRLDRIAIRVELLRRRLARSPWWSAEGLAHYRSVINKLTIDRTLKSLLIEQLEPAQRAR